MKNSKKIQDLTAKEIKYLTSLFKKKQAIYVKLVKERIRIDNNQAYGDIEYLKSPEYLKLQSEYFHAQDNYSKALKNSKLDFDGQRELERPLKVEIEIYQNGKRIAKY